MNEEDHLALLECLVETYFHTEWNKNYIQAIKEYRSETGAGLKEAKTVLDELRFTKDPKKVVSRPGKVDFDIVKTIQAKIKKDSEKEWSEYLTERNGQFD